MRLDHVLESLFDVFTVVLAAKWLLFGLKLDAEKTKRVRIIVVIADLFALHTKLNLVSVDIQGRYLDPKLLEKRFLGYMRMNRHHFVAAVDSETCTQLLRLRR